MNVVVDTPCGNCQHKARIMGWYCQAWDTLLRSSFNGPIRCFDCMNDCKKKALEDGKANG